MEFVLGNGVFETLCFIFEPVGYAAVELVIGSFVAGPITAFGNRYMLRRFLPHPYNNDNSDRAYYQQAYGHKNGN